MAKRPKPKILVRPPGEVKADRARELILKVLKDGYSIQRACRAAHISRGTYYRWLGEDEEWAKQVADAIDDGTDFYEDEARRRAVEGVSKMIVSAGRRMGYEQQYSDQLMQFMLKARRPEKYRENSTVDLNANINVAGAAERLASKLLDLFDKKRTRKDARQAG